MAIKIYTTKIYKTNADFKDYILQKHSLKMFSILEKIQINLMAIAIMYINKLKLFLDWYYNKM